jgi:peroxiredoxin
MHRSRRFAALVLLVVALIAVPAMAGDLAPGAKAPDFVLTDFAGETHKLSDYEGKIVVLEWTNPQCPFVINVYGNDTMLPLSLWAQQQGVVWLTIDSSYFVTADTAKRWAESVHMEQPILLDPTGNVGKLYGAKTTPNMFVINEEGVLVYAGAFDNNPKPSGEGDVNYVRRAITATQEGMKPEVTKVKPYGCSIKYAKDDKPAKDATPTKEGA